MKKVLIGIAVVVVVIVAAAVAAPFFIPKEEIKTQITQGVETATGRTLTIAGDLDVSVLPSLAVVANDITFANADGAADPNMAAFKELRIKLQLWPLITGTVKVDEFVLVDPVINLEIAKNGKPNWEFAAAPAAPDAAPSSGGSADAGATGGSAIEQISLGDIRLVNGSLTFFDVASGARHVVSEINLAVSLTDLDSPFTAEGSLLWNDKTIDLSVISDNPRGLTSGEQAPVVLSVGSDVLKLAFDGSVTTAATLLVAGALDVSTPSVRDLAAWTGNPVALEGTGLGPFNLSGKIDVKGSIYSFTEAKLGLDEITGEGSVKVATGGAKPQIDAELKLGVLDLNPYLPPAEEGEASASESSGAGAGSGSAAPADWSDDPIDVSALRALNANLALSVAGILVQEIKVGQSALTVGLKDGLLAVDLNELNLYDGKGKGRLTVDARGEVPAVTESFTMTGIAAEPLLTDAAGFERLSGTGNLDISVTARGGSQRQMVETLNGKGSLAFNDGAIKGINLAAMVRNVADAFLDPGASETQKTDFAELSGTFDIRNGLLSNNDLKLLSPLLRVEGRGTSNLPPRTLDYRIEPKAVASLEGQGGNAGESGLAVPVLVSGPWHDLSYKPDLTGAIEDIAKDPSKLLDSVGGGTKALEGVIKGGDGEGGIKLPDDAGKALKGLFGN
jgi:AsmA protein